MLHYQDITERRLAEEQLAASERRFRSLVQNVSETVSLMDAAGRILMTTGDFKPILGYPSTFWQQRSAFDLTHPDDAPRLLESLARSLANPGQEITDEAHARHADGHWEHLQITAVNLLDDPGRRRTRGDDAQHHGDQAGTADRGRAIAECSS